MTYHKFIDYLQCNFFKPNSRLFFVLFFFYNNTPQSEAVKVNNKIVFFLPDTFNLIGTLVSADLSDVYTRLICICIVCFTLACTTSQLNLLVHVGHCSLGDRI